VLEQTTLVTRIVFDYPRRIGTLARAIEPNAVRMGRGCLKGIDN